MEPLRIHRDSRIAYKADKATPYEVYVRKDGYELCVGSFRAFKDALYRAAKGNYLS